jgi:hypothetical protein
MAYGPRIQTKKQLKDYILRQLGAPVINIEITEDQLDDAIDNALELYMQRAYSGVKERYIPLQLVEGQQSYQLPYDVFSILSVKSSEMGGITNSAPSNFFSMNIYLASDLYAGNGKVDLLSYELTNELLSTINLLFSKKVTFDFNCVSKELYLFSKPVMTENAMVECYIKNVPTYEDNPIIGQPEIEITNIYNELPIKTLSTAYCRRQWADNLMKYSGSVLPNGLNIDVPSMSARAEADVLKYELEIFEQYSLPIDFMIG